MVYGTLVGTAHVTQLIWHTVALHVTLCVANSEVND